MNACLRNSLALAALAFSLFAPAWSYATEEQPAEISAEIAAPVEPVIAETPAPPEEEAPANEPPAQPLRDLTSVEGIGIYQKAYEGALDRNMWESTPRPVVETLITALPASSSAPITQQLVFSALLSPFRADKIAGDQPPAPGRDLLTLRMQKLIEGGAFERAFALYSALKEDPYDAALAEAGALAMFSSGRKSTGCLEINSVIADFPDSAMLRAAHDYCQASLAETPQADALKDSPYSQLAMMARDKSHHFSYKPEAFSALSPLERAMLAAENRLNIPEFEAQDMATIPVEHIQPLLAAADLSEKNRFLLSVRAVSFGLLPVKALKDFYVQSTKPAAGNASQPRKAEKEWEKLPFLFIQAQNADSDEKWSLLRQAFPHAKTYGISALAPFADILAKTRPENPTLDELNIAYAAMASSGAHIPDQWLDAVEKFDDGANDPERYARLLTTAYIARGESKPDAETLKRLDKALSMAGKNTEYFLHTVIENIDNAYIKDNNAYKIYEKEKGLTLSIDYVMPSSQVWNRLNQAATEKHIGETVLLSAMLLRDAAPGDLYPGLLHDVLRNLSSVGLSNVSRSMAMGAVLGDIN